MKVKRIVANIETEDTSKAKQFYEKILGLDQLMDLGFIATYGSNEKMATQISFLSEGGSGTPVPNLSIEVDNLDEVLTRIEKVGVAHLNMDQLQNRGELDVSTLEIRLGN